MPRRSPILITDEIYHVFNRGVEKRGIFLTTQDYKHFLETLDYYRWVRKAKLSRRGRGKQLVQNLANKQLVTILAYCLMPNHFHFLLKQEDDSGISNYIRLVGNSFTRYFNTKNERPGPLFQGPFKAVKVESDSQLIHLSRYIHLNPLVANLVSDLKDYPWSSYRSYVGLEFSSNQRLNSLNKEIVMSLVASEDEYKSFVLDQTEYAKSLEEIKHHILD